MTLLHQKLCCIHVLCAAVHGMICYYADELDDTEVRLIVRNHMGNSEIAIVRSVDRVMELSDAEMEVVLGSEEWMAARDVRRSLRLLLQA